ncbi:MAG: deoxyribose-phosphate aldolase [Tannerellaceae bacterium]|jgi:deoxyribose-phosphate aldolase|nr:deoxyribose-phosphate aldolase [Tannerellaceae bacterium]
MDKYQEAFARFKPAGTDREVKEKVERIRAAQEGNHFTADVLKLIHGCIDVTSLSAMDTKEKIWRLVEGINDFEGSRPDVPNVAAICTYPLFTETVKQALTAQEVKIVAVTGGFPAAQTFEEVKIAETALAVMSGAEEIDTVLNPGAMLEENYQELAGQIEEIKASAHDAPLKVILETGALGSMENVRKAAIFAIYAGADFIKTSTGKEFPGATPEAAYTMCEVIKAYHSLTGIRIGIKLSGGIRTAEEAVTYYTIVKEVLGEEWLNKSYFRIGASSLADDIMRHLGE